MKPIPLLFLAVWVSISPARSQEEKSTVPDEPAASTTARILGTLPDGTPPPPEEPKPGFSVPAGKVIEREIVQEGGRRITLQRVAPIKLPPPLEAPRIDVADPAIQQRVGDFSEEHPNTEFLFIGGSVFHSKDSSVRTLVNLSPLGRGESVTFWSSADFGLLSGFSSFVGSDGITHSLMMAWSRQEVDSLSDLVGKAADGSGISKIPDLPAGKATFAITQGKPDAETLTAIQSLHDLYNNDYERLKTAFEGRERARIANEAELKAHPPKPKDIVLNYWRIGAAKPAADVSQKGGEK
ncbi:MAG: hypothetical protein ABIT37_23670 [Luteolibacter sp.]